MDVVSAIERTKTNKHDRPFEDIKIVDITIKEYINEVDL